MKKTILFIIFSLLAIVILYSIYTQFAKQDNTKKLDRLVCHKKVTCFEKGYDRKQIEEAKQKLRDGNLKIISGIEKSTYMPSSLFGYVSIEDMEKFFYNNIESTIQKEIVFDDGITFQITIYENDRDDPKKKSDNCKLFRGYVILEVLNTNKKLLYKIQIDFLDEKGEDIPNALECALQSFLSY